MLPPAVTASPPAARLCSPHSRMNSRDRQPLVPARPSPPVGLSPARVHQIMADADLDGLDATLGELRAAGWPAPEDRDGDDDAERTARLLSLGCASLQEPQSRMTGPQCSPVKGGPSRPGPGAGAPAPAPQGADSGRVAP
jgi:hypothetical protein